MAIAVAMLFGYHLSDNFKRPYLATDIAGFWRRWHISLTSWFRDYLYIPLGGNRKGKIRKYINVLIVFLVSGLWHGASWNFVIWGGIHAAYQIVGGISLKYRIKFCEKLKLDRETWSYHLWQRICVFGLTTMAWIFFRASSFPAALDFIYRMFTRWNPWVLVDGTLFQVGISAVDWGICAIAVLLLLVVSLLQENNISADIFFKQNFPFRLCCYLGLYCFIFIFGIYGPGYAASAFIYAGF